MVILTGKEIIGVRDILKGIEHEISQVIVAGEVLKPEMMGQIEEMRIELLKTQSVLGKRYMDLRAARLGMPVNECEDGA